MALTLGSGPLGHDPAGDLNARIEGPANTLYFEGYPRRIRALLGGETVIDTVAGRLLYESSLPPVLYVPLGDVAPDLIEPTAHTSHCPYKGDASYWTVRAGGKVAENALWGYPAPIESAAWLRGYVAPYWDAMDTWYEEDEQLPHPIRDTYHRVEVRRAAVRVSVRAHGEIIAESKRPKLLFETGLAPRAYIPAEDVRPGVLVPSDKTSVCPYKGSAGYWAVRAGGTTIDDAAWSYGRPFAEAAAVEGLVSFAGDGIEVEIERDLDATVHEAA